MGSLSHWEYSPQSAGEALHLGTRPTNSLITHYLAERAVATIAWICDNDLQHFRCPALYRARVAYGECIQPKYRVLVVDDNQDIAIALGKLLELYGYATAVTTDSTKALGSAQGFRPHFVLLDIAMPGLSGCTLSKLIRAQPELANVVLIAHSGFSDKAHIAMAFEAGCDHHVAKPLEMKAFNRLTAGEIEKRHPGVDGFFTKIV